jgi:hypothetical protein
VSTSSAGPLPLVDGSLRARNFDDNVALCYRTLELLLLCLRGYIEPTHHEARRIGEDSRDEPAAHGSVDETEAELGRHIANGRPEVQVQDLADEQPERERSRCPKQRRQPGARAK